MKGLFDVTYACFLLLALCLLVLGLLSGVPLLGQAELRAMFITQPATRGDTSDQ